MTAAALTQLPLAAGHALASSLGRAALWGLARYARAPLSNTAIAGLGIFSLLAASNALYFQKHHHPAPLFAPARTQVAEIQPVPVIPAVRTKPRTAPAAVQTITGSVPARKVAPAEGPIGNDEVTALQRRLTDLGVYKGKLDGLYGPRTAAAIRKFEDEHGLKPAGMLTREILARILATPGSARVAPAAAPVVAPPAVVTHAVPEPAPTQPVMVVALPGDGAPEAPRPVAVPLPHKAAEASTMQPLPAPEPLRASVNAQAQPTAAVPQRQLPQSVEQAVEIASGVANNAADAVGAALDGDIRLGPSAPSQPMPAPAADSQMAMAPALDEGTDEGEDVADAPIVPESQGVPPMAEPAGTGDTVAEIVTAEMDPVTTAPVSTVDSKDPRLVAKVQRGLASLGFLSGQIDGRPGEATARAIRNFEVWNNYDVTGRVTPELLKLLIAAGAEI
jgi:peptidoglycan hydrolase-like protein with peptidoglycan-binding domain